MTENHDNLPVTAQDIGQAPLTNLIRARMNELGIDTLDKFAESIVVVHSIMYDLYSGRRDNAGQLVTPTLEVLFKLEIALNTPIADLVEYFRPKQQKQPNKNLIDYTTLIGILPMTQTGVDYQRELRGEVHVDKLNRE